MNARIHRRVRPQLEALESRWCPSTARPISDFLSAQGSTSLFPNGINVGGPAGLPDELGWATSTATFANGTARFARVDYTGQDAAFLHLNLGTTTSGTVSERVLKDGRAEVTIALHTKNAFAWANQFDLDTNPVIFGYLPSQLAADPSLKPPLADCNLHVVAIIPYAGAPLPDLVAPNTPAGLPTGYTIVSEEFNATAKGTTPSGQQATLVVSEVGLLARTPQLIRDFGFTAEVVDVHTHGTAAPAAQSDTSKSTATPTTPAMNSSTPSVSDLAAIDNVFATGVDHPVV